MPTPAHKKTAQPVKVGRLEAVYRLTRKQGGHKLRAHPTRAYFVSLKLARWYVPSFNCTTNCRQVPAQLLSVFHT